MGKDISVTIVAMMAILALGFVLFMNVYEPLKYLDNPIYGHGLGNLCDSEESCKVFCHTSKGRCNKYCQGNPSNELCNVLFGGR